MANVVVKDCSKAWLAATKVNLDAGVRAMSDAINTLASVKAPVLTGALRSDGRVEKIENGYAVVYGDSRVPYARRRHFENNLHPQTKYYLRDAGDTIAKRGLGVFL